MTATQTLDFSIFSLEEVATLAKATAILKSKLYLLDQPLLTTPKLVKTFCQCSLASRDHEVFCIIFLDTQFRVRKIEELFTGTLGEAAIYPREVVKKALAYNASGVLLYHNHPSGSLDISEPDRTVTQRLKDALALIGVQVIDHVVVSFEGAVTFAEKGLI